VVVIYSDVSEVRTTSISKLNESVNVDAEATLQRILSVIHSGFRQVTAREGATGG
jgi:hypothetical protein